MEQLIGSQSLFSALERLLTIGVWNLTRLILTVVWLLSPLGGQAALRLLATDSSTSNTTASYQFLNPNALSGSLFDDTGTLDQGLSSYTPTFYLAVSNSGGYQTNPVDMYSNVKIPSRAAATGPPDADGWQDVGKESNVTYASLLGVPVIRPDTPGNSTYTIRARYFSINCSSNSHVDAPPPAELRGSWNLTMENKVCTAYPCPFTLVSLASGSNTTRANWGLDLEYVEVLISCVSSACRAARSRLLPLLSDGYDASLDNKTRSAIAPRALTQLPIVEAPSGYGQPSTAEERWIFDPSSFLDPVRGNVTHVDLWQLAPDVLASRLEILFNTLVQVTYALDAVTTSQVSATTTTTNGDSIQPDFNVTIASVITTIPDGRYRCSWGWFAALLVSSIVLQIAASLGFVLKYTTLAPDMVGYVSSLALFNPYIPAPVGSTALNGLDRSAVLKDLPVRIGDVLGTEPVGAIALTGGDMVVGVARLRKKRLYG